MVFDDFLSSYPPGTIDKIVQLRELILQMFTHIEEEVDVSARILGYTFGKGYKNTLCTIIPSKKSVKLGFYRGIDFNDPHEVLAGKGKVHRYVEIVDFKAQKSCLEDLLNEGFRLWLLRRGK